MKRILRISGRLFMVCGLAALLWTVVVWRWQDPFTALYTKFKQDRLAHQYDRLVARYNPPHFPHSSLAAVRRVVAREARGYRLETHEGEAIGRIVVPRLHLNMVLVDGTDEGSLQKGPGRDLRTYMPGEGRLVYIAGHRTTFLAPFSHIERLRPGDNVTLRVPYAAFTRSRAARAAGMPPALLRHPSLHRLRAPGQGVAPIRGAATVLLTVTCPSRTAS